MSEFDKDRVPFTFGKYKGKTPDEIADKHPSYLVWVYEKHSEGKKLLTKDLYKACRATTDREDSSIGHYNTKTILPSHNVDELFFFKEQQ